MYCKLKNLAAHLWDGLLTTQLCIVNFAYYIYIAYIYAPKPLPTLIINGTNCFYYDIDVYNFNPLINVVILQVLI